MFEVKFKSYWTGLQLKVDHLPMCVFN